jgi:hypothetical protein
MAVPSMMWFPTQRVLHTNAIGTDVATVAKAWMPAASARLSGTFCA